MRPVEVEGLARAFKTVPHKIGKPSSNSFRMNTQKISTMAPIRLPLKPWRDAPTRMFASIIWRKMKTLGGLVEQQLFGADNMTDISFALNLIANCEHPRRADLLGEFYERWKKDDLLLDRWFGIQARARLPHCLDDVKRLTKHPAFKKQQNPNRVRALLGGFFRENLTAFHAASGEGYRLCREQTIEIDRFNPQLASRMVFSLSRWQDFDAKRQKLMINELKNNLRAAGTIARCV